VAPEHAETYTAPVAKLFLLFTIVPLLDLYVLLLIGDRIGFWPTVGIVVLTGVVGAWLAHSEGLRVLRDWRRAILRGKVPEDGVLGGLLVLVGGVLLVTPGVLTDIVGLLLLIPPTRRLIAAWIRRGIERRISSGQIQVVNYTTYNTWDEDRGPPHRDTQRPPFVVADVEAEVIDRDDDDDDRPADRRTLH
jgi:UPF0716 protein FxsA